MSILKKAFGISAAVAVCMGLSACSVNNSDNDYPDVVGDDWRVTDVVCDSGTITRNEGDTDVLVCVLTEGAAFYYDTKDQLLFDTVFYPTELAQKVALSGDVRGMYKSIDFVDLNGAGDSDVTMKFDDSISRVYSYIGSIRQYYKRPDHFFFRLARTIITTAATAIAAAA